MGRIYKEYLHKMVQFKMREDEKPYINENGCLVIPLEHKESGQDIDVIITNKEEFNEVLELAKTLLSDNPIQ